MGRHPLGLTSEPNHESHWQKQLGWTYNKVCRAPLFWCPPFFLKDKMTRESQCFVILDRVRRLISISFFFKCWLPDGEHFFNLLGFIFHLNTIQWIQVIHNTAYPPPAYDQYEAYSQLIYFWMRMHHVLNLQSIYPFTNCIMEKQIGSSWIWTHGTTMSELFYWRLSARSRRWLVTSSFLFWIHFFINW